MTDSESKPAEGGDLRDQLKSMEAKLSRLRDIRNGHSDAGKRNAEARNAVQKEYNRLRSEVNEKLDENKEIRARAQAHKARRNAIQEQVRELIGQARSNRGDSKEKSPVVEFSEVQAQIAKLARTVETSPMGLDKENRIMRQIKTLQRRKRELEPLVKEAARIKIDLDNIEGSIQDLKAQADAEHQAMLDENKAADEIWESLKPLFEERDFKKAEGDRLHEAFVECRKQADEAHAEVVEMLKQVNEIRDKLNQERIEAQSWIDDHNESVRKALTTPDQDEGLASRLTESLLAGGSVAIGGTQVEKVEHSGRGGRSNRKANMRRLSASRGRRGRSTPKKDE